MKYSKQSLDNLLARVRQERISVQHGSPSDVEIAQAQLADMAGDYLPGLIEAVIELAGDLEHYNKVLAHADQHQPAFTHAQVANKVRMLTRGDLDHEMVCVLARDRIILLAQDNRDLATALATTTEQLATAAQVSQEMQRVLKSGFRGDTLLIWCERYGDDADLDYVFDKLSRRCPAGKALVGRAEKAERELATARQELGEQEVEKMELVQANMGMGELLGDVLHELKEAWAQAEWANIGHLIEHLKAKAGPAPAQVAAEPPAAPVKKVCLLCFVQCENCPRTLQKPQNRGGGLPLERGADAGSDTAETLTTAQMIARFGFDPSEEQPERGPDLADYSDDVLPGSLA